MGKKLGAVLVALGVFLIVLGALARFYAYPKLAVVPLDQYSSSAKGAEDPPSVSVAPGATIFSLAEGGKEITTDLHQERNTVGQVADSEKLNDETGENLAIYETFSWAKDGEGRVISGTFDRVTFDRNTGAVYHCSDELTDLCDEKTGSTTPADFDIDETPLGTPDDVVFVHPDDSATDAFSGFQGHYFKMPFNTQKKTYQWWDGSLGKATDMKYRGAEKIDGLTTYKFVQTIEPTKVSEQELPASFAGLDQEGDITADRMYSNIRTLWIEPETGVLIKGQEQVYTTFQYQGEDVITVSDYTIGYTDDTIKENADKYKPLSTQLKLIRAIVPLVGLVLGLVLVGVGLFLTFRSRRSTARGHAAA